MPPSVFIHPVKLLNHDVGIYIYIYMYVCMYVCSYDKIFLSILWPLK